MDNGQDQPLLRNNPFFVIFIACAIASLMILVSVVSYVQSDTKKTIEQIQTNNNSIRNNSFSFPKNGEITTETLDTAEKNITENIQSHDDEADFSPSELTDSALGL